MEKSKYIEIDQKPNDRLLIECNCGFSHYLQFSIDVDEYRYETTDEKLKNKKGWKSYDIAFIDNKRDFRSKLKDCWRYLTRNDIDLCYTGIGITSEDINKIIKHFEKYKKL